MKFYLALRFVPALLALVSKAAAADENHLKARAMNTCGNPANARPFYRTYNSDTSDHRYTLTVNQSAIDAGYLTDGITGYIFPSRQQATIPLYRLYSSSATDHLYATSEGDRQAAKASGYVEEGVEGYVYADAKCGGVPLYGLSYSDGDLSRADSFYTASTVERDSAVEAGYRMGNVVGYVYPYTSA